MPIFEYHCRKCDKLFEKIVLSRGKLKIVCPECGSGQVECLVSAPAVHNTGSVNAVLRREYKAYRKSWSENAYLPKPKKKS